MRLREPARRGGKGLSIMNCAGLLAGLALTTACATLHGPARRGETAVVAERVAGGADIEARDEGGNTPLHVAALRGREGVVDVLVAAGADVDARNRAGATPLHYWAINAKGSGPCVDVPAVSRQRPDVRWCSFRPLAALRSRERHA